MKILHKILSVILMLSLLISTFGFTLEHHFCNHCEEGFKTTWFLIPEKPRAAHNCSCSLAEMQSSCCSEQCEIDQSKHVTHYNAEITSIIPPNNSENLISHISFISFSGAFSEISDFWFEKDIKPLLKQLPRPPNLVSINIVNCCFLI